MLERWDRLSKYRVPWPEWSVEFAASVLRYLTLAVFLAGVAWWASVWRKRRRAEKEEPVHVKEFR